jgi:hypothetical protein
MFKTSTAVAAAVMVPELVMPPPLLDPNRPILLRTTATWPLVIVPELVMPPPLLVPN